MKREDYLEVRKKLQNGQLDEQGWKLFYEYWVLFKKENYQDIYFDKFAETFSQYLGYGLNYQSAVSKLFKYYDELYSLQTVTNIKTGATLAIR